VLLPSWDLVSSGIAEDVVYLLSAIESGTTKIWAEDVKFSDNDENLLFKKILLMIIAHLADIDIYVFVKYFCQFYFINFEKKYIYYYKREIKKKYTKTFLNLFVKYDFSGIKDSISKHILSKTFIFKFYKEHINRKFFNPF